MSLTFERLAGPYSLTEGPAWDGGGLLFTDVRNNRILRFDDATRRIDVFREGTNQANGLMFDRQGRLYACEGGGRRVVRYDRDGGTTVIADRLDGRRLNSPNDLAIDSRGRIWFTDPRYGNDRSDMELDHESVLRATSRDDGTWSVERVTRDTTRPNGLLLSADERWLYVAQSSYVPAEGRQLRAYPIADDGSVGTYRVLHDFGENRGIDGMCLDTEGNIVATCGWETGGPGGRIAVFAPDGTAIEEHRLSPPVKRPTNCTFGGPDLTTLYVTDIDGHLHRAETGRRGRLWWPAAS
ncbi:MAG: SMP-30/gluconolactonase/LRE family protein [Chloroflexota bacterium]|nr:MAG: SMP-30/gluconolactonase/LRE family protein [Chloroflexota bacterium]